MGCFQGSWFIDNKPIADNSVEFLKDRQLCLGSIKNSLSPLFVITLPPDILRIEVSISYQAAKHLKWNLDFMSKIEGWYNTPTHTTHGFMTLTIFIIFRSLQKMFVKWLLDVEVENIKNSTYYEKKWFIVLSDFVKILLFTERQIILEALLENILGNI